jgi:Lrp/AsnC family leucine-responsive transcriptional regulator
MQGLLLDEIDLRILDLLQRDARITMRALGSAIGLSGAAATDRVRRLEDRGLLRGYHADVSPSLIGLGVMAFVSLGLPYDEHSRPRFESQIHEIDEVAECYRVSGEDQYLVKVLTRDIPALQDVLDRFRGFSRVRSSVVLGTLKQEHRIQPPAPPSPRSIAHQGAD